MVLLVPDKGWFLLRCGEKVEWYDRTLTGRPAPTYWPAVTYPNTPTILAYFEPITALNTDLPAGFITEIKLRIYTAASIGHRDRIRRPETTGWYYDIETQPELVRSIRGRTYRTAIIVRVW